MSKKVEIKNNININDIKKAKGSHIWDLSNTILYDMVENNFQNTDEKTVYAKINIIGRVYAASIERGKNKEDSELPSEIFMEKVAQKIINAKIDEDIKYLSNYKTINENNIRKILQLHQKLTKIFYKLTKQEKRSLASKYLHFHLPDLFYIFDRRAVQGISIILPRFRGTKNNFKNCDEKYTKFFLKVFYLQKGLKNEFEAILTPRQIDTLLLNKVSANGKQ